MVNDHTLTSSFGASLIFSRSPDGQQLSAWHWPVAHGGLYLLALHGFPDCPASFGEMAQALRGAGIGVVAPVLPGYGECPALVPPTLEALAKTLLHAWVHNGPLGPPAAFLGHDWGAAIGYAAAALGANTVKHWAFVSVPPMPNVLWSWLSSTEQRGRSAYMAAFQLPGAEAPLARHPELTIRTIWRQWSPNWSPPPALIRATAAHLPSLEHWAQALAYYRNLLPRHPLAWARSVRLAFAPPPPKGGIYFGQTDACIAHTAYPNSATCIPGAGHFLPAEAPNALATHLIRQIWKNSTP